MRRPEQEGHFDLLPLDELTAQEFDNFWRNLRYMLGEPYTGKRLQQRHFVGTLERHGGEPDASYESLEGARRQSAAGKLGAYAIRIEGEKWAGMATVMKGLPLRRPATALAGLLPAHITRRSPLLAPRVHTPGPNIAAWVGAEFEDSVLTDAYGHLRELGGEGSWTIEPAGAKMSTRAIQASGMVAVGPLMRYDDFEADGIPPVSQYFESPAQP